MPYHTFTAVRATKVDPASALRLLRANVDATMGMQHDFDMEFRLKKDSAWTAAHITAAQTILDTAPSRTAQRDAQAELDSLPLAFRALVLALVDQINVLRGRLGLAEVTPAQALQAIRDKAGTL